MKSIVLCGSMKVLDKIYEVKEILESKGFNVILPKECIDGLPKVVASKAHFNRIIDPKNEIILVVNSTKNGIENYIGPNSFAEIAFAFYYLKKFNTRDGMGISLLKGHDIKFAIITGENSEIVKRRAEKFGITEYYLGVKNKLEIFNLLKQKYAISNEEIAYIGDDINDYEVMRNAGLACCPSNAIESVKSVAGYVTNTKSGEGVVREVIDYILNNR